MRKFLLVAALVAAAACGEKSEDGSMDTSAMAPATTADSGMGAMADSMGKMADSMGAMADTMKKMAGDTTKM